MKRKSLLLLFCAALAFAAPANASEDVFLAGYTGFDYEDPNNSATYLDLLEGYKLVGFVTSVGPLLAPYYDATLYEYTIHLFDLTVNGRFFGGGFLTVTFMDDGRGRYYRDPTFNADYGINPPNATSPSTFTDGTMILGGDIDDAILTYDFNINQGNFSGAMTQDEGPWLIYIPPAQRGGWILTGLAGRPNNTIPDGYDNQVQGECRIPKATPTTHRTWGSVKALYR